tara:strand:- start:428 stop:793 length:366 start_codon:yes stop_codon:yes gene_type:complete
MENEYNVDWRVYIMYVLIMVFVFISSTTFGQITATHFNAEWNNANGCEWFMDLEDCKTKSVVDVGKNPNEAKKYKIAVVPTIIIFKDGEEALRFQADLSFKMVATKKEIQNAIDELLMSDF